jgi:CSLREA domain-containing protein
METIGPRDVRRSAKRLAVGAVLAVCGVLVFAHVANAATFVVTTTLDSADASVGDGACAAESGACTLRAAVQEANAIADPDTIILPAGTFAITTPGLGEDQAASGDLDLRTDITIVGAGPGATLVDGNHLDRVFDAFPRFGSPPNVVRIEHVAITNGVGDPGGGIVNDSDMVLTDVLVNANASSLDGGGIWSGGVLHVTDSTVVDNHATGGSGGGIGNSFGGRLTVERSSIARNTAARDGGGIFNSALFSLRGSVTIMSSTLSGNRADGCGGGGALFSRGNALLDQVVVDGNVAGCQGGGVTNAGGTLDVVDSTLARNRAGSGGGMANAGTANVVRSTFAGNQATFAFGGAILGGGTLTVVNSTLSGNTASQSGGAIRARFARLAIASTTIADNSVVGPGVIGFGDPDGGGLFLEEGAIVDLVNTVLDGNTRIGGAASNCAGTVPPVSLGHNLEDASTCGLAESGDLSSIDALLAPLADNGGPTETHALLPASPARDAGDDAQCPSTDQRGVARPQGAACDTGAFELEAALPTPIEIDIRPESPENTINCRNPNGVIAVALLTTESFDAFEFDHASARLEAASEIHAVVGVSQRHVEDVDGDGDLDLVFHFRLGDTTLTCQSVQAALTGTTLDGRQVEGVDSVRMLDPQGG